MKVDLPVKTLLKALRSGGGIALSEEYYSGLYPVTNDLANLVRLEVTSSTISIESCCGAEWTRHSIPVTGDILVEKAGKWCLMAKKPERFFTFSNLIANNRVSLEFASQIEELDTDEDDDFPAKCQGEIRIATHSLTPHGKWAINVFDPTCFALNHSEQSSYLTLTARSLARSLKSLGNYQSKNTEILISAVQGLVFIILINNDIKVIKELLPHEVIACEREDTIKIKGIKLRQALPAFEKDNVVALSFNRLNNTLLFDAGNVQHNAALETPLLGRKDLRTLSQPAVCRLRVDAEGLWRAIGSCALANKNRVELSVNRPATKMIISAEPERDSNGKQIVSGGEAKGYSPCTVINGAFREHLPIEPKDLVYYLRRINGTVQIDVLEGENHLRITEQNDPTRHIIYPILAKERTSSSYQSR